MNEILSIASGVVMVVGLLWYVRSVVYGTTRPTRGSWATWAILDAVLLGSMYMEGTLNGQVVGATVGSICVMCLAFCGWGKPGWTRLEVGCLAVVPFGLLLWYITADAVWSIIISLALLTIGCWPTYQSIWKDPSRESKTAWTLIATSSLLLFPTLPTIHEWTVEVVAQPLVFFLTALPVMYLLWIHPHVKKK